MTNTSRLTYRLWESGKHWRIFRVFSRQFGTQYFVARCVYRTGIKRVRFQDMNSALAYCI